jgi:nitrate reductase gamma subunit
MYEFFAGPMLYVSLLVFVFGCAWRVYKYVKGLSWQLDRVAYGTDNELAVKGALRSIFHWLIPFYSRNWQQRPGFAVATFAFHIGLVFVPLFLFAHVMIIKERFGISWPTLPGVVADALTIGMMIGALFLTLRRIAFPEVRILTTAYDYLIIAISVAPFLTGFLSAHNVGDHDTWLLAHVIAGEIMLIAIPFTKLAHVVLFFCSRAQIGIDFGIKRGGQKGRGIVW